MTRTGWPSLWTDDGNRSVPDGSSRRSGSDPSDTAARPAERPSLPPSAPSVTSPWLFIQSAVLAAGLFGVTHVYKRHLRQLPSVGHIKPNEYRVRTLRGYVTSVGDGDNFRLYHTPGGFAAGWGWLPGRKAHLAVRAKAGTETNAKCTFPTLPKNLRAQTLHVRIAGVDAPELAHFGRPAQPYGEEALVCLRSLVLHRTVRAKIWRPDQYGRVVATVHTRAPWTGLWRRRDVGLEMLRAGAATVYEAKYGSEFGGQEEVYRQAERRARERKVGMWAGLECSGSQKPGLLSWFRPSRDGSARQAVETPREFKNRMKGMEDRKQ